ncbi:MAG TPA: DUF2332 domain-containing protein [Anaerolineae bacterium]|nr:DUF2332 domain-containing protein [Anaerolineae bacterium]
MNPLISPELHTLAEEFLWNAEHVFHGDSPLYEKLARRIVNDPEILALAAHTPPRQPPSNLLFASVHYLLLRGKDDPLAIFYPDLTRKPDTTDDPYPVFRAFCLEHADEIIPLVETRRVQTNEVARCSFFFPAFTLIASRVHHEPLALIEVGSSAGLNLNWDRYAYDYGDDKLYGDTNSSILLKCELRGAHRPSLPNGEYEFPRAASRVGVDIHPNDVNDDDAMRWLRALVWPEQLDRAERLQQAIALAREFPPRLLAGDALELVPPLLAEIPPSAPVVLFHSFVLNQISSDARAQYYALLEQHSAERELFDVAVEPQEWPAPLVLTTLYRGERAGATLASCDYHGRWLEWMNRYNDASL